MDIVTTHSVTITLSHSNGAADTLFAMAKLIAMNHGVQSQETTPPKPADADVDKRRLTFALSSHDADTLRTVAGIIANIASDCGGGWTQP